MAFMGIFIMWMAVIFGILGFLFFAAAVCFVLSAVIKRRYEKKLSEGFPVKRPVSVTVLKIAGWVFLIPAVGAVLLIFTSIAGEIIKNRAADIPDTEQIRIECIAE